VALKTNSTILATLKKLNTFSSAQEVYAEIQKSKNEMGLTTVYRALQKLADSKEIDFVRREDGEGAYKLCSDNHHHHLICEKCGKSVEFASAKFEKLLETIADENGFEPLSHDASILGLCRSCNRGNKSGT
jgi:Fur family ferric uptake transcriptional regulator